MIVMSFRGEHSKQWIQFTSPDIFQRKKKAFARWGAFVFGILTRKLATLVGRRGYEERA